MVKERPYMSKETRAKQFSPFAALTGLDERTDAAGFIPDERILLASESLEELDRAARGLCKGDHIRIRFYHGGRYIEKSGRVSKYDTINRTIILDEERIHMDDIVSIHMM